MDLGEALDVGLVDDRVGVGDRGRGVVAPVEAVADDEAAGYVRGRVQAAEAVRVAGDIGQDRLAPFDLTADRSGVRVQEELVGVAAQAVGGLVRALDAIPITLARTNSRHEAMPDAGVAFGEGHLLLRPGLVEEAESDALGYLRGDGEVGSIRRCRGAERKRPTGPDLHLQIRTAALVPAVALA